MKNTQMNRFGWMLALAASILTITTVQAETPFGNEKAGLRRI